MKSRLHGSSTHPNSSTSLKSQPPSKPKKSTNPSQKSSSQGFYQQIYRLPSSMKRTEEMINKSILKQHISSRILDLVGNTFRVKNAIQSQVTFPTRAPTVNVSRPRPSYTKEHSSSRILETCYEEEGEDEDDEEINSNTAIHSTDRNNLSVRRIANDDSTEKSMIMNKSVGSIRVNTGSNNSSSSRNLQRIVTAGGNLSNKNQQNSNCTNLLLPKHWDHERNSVSPGRINVKDLVKADIRTLKPPSRKSVEKPATGTRQKSEEKKSIPVNNHNNKKSMMMKELKKTVKVEKEKAIMTPWEGRLPRSKENEINTSSKDVTNSINKESLPEKPEKKVLSVRTQSQEKKVQIVMKKEEIGTKEEAINMPRAVVQKDYYSCSSHVEINHEESTSEEIIRQTREALEKVLAPRVSKEENMKFSIYKSINDFERKLSGHAMTRYSNLRKCLDSREKWEEDEDTDDKEEYRIKKVVGNY